jgi:hypothetical protein
MTDEWRSMTSDYTGTIAVGGTGKLYIFWLLNRKKPFILNLPHASVMGSWMQRRQLMLNFLV